MTEQSPSTSIPVVAIDPAMRRSKRSVALQTLLRDAATRLDNLDAWKLSSGALEIVIFQVGVGEGQTVGAGVWTDPAADPQAAPSSPVRRDPNKNIRILVDESLFRNGFGKRMVDKGASKINVALWCLAHESFHFDECERMSAAGILMSDRHSTLAAAARPEFSQEWKDAFVALSRAYPTDADLPPGMQVAGEIASEAAADIAALRHLAALGVDWKLFGERLASARQDADDEWKKAEEGLVRAVLRRFGRRYPAPYRIAEQISDFLIQHSGGLPDFLDIYSQCWIVALEKILASGALDPALRPVLRAAQDAPTVPPATAKSQPSPRSSP